MHFADILKQFRIVLTSKLSSGEDRSEFIEVTMILILGLLCGLFNPNQVAEQLGISPNKLYSTLREMDARQWRALLEKLMLERAIEELKKYVSASASGRSRLQASLSIDDTLVKRLSEVLSYVWAWYSGQVKDVRRGQDLLGIVLKINGRILPLSLVWVSKQGRGSTNKPSVLLREMKRLKELMNRAGVDITILAISLDSWWASNPVSTQLAEEGLRKQVICAKANLVFETKEGRKKLPLHRKEIELKEGWGHSEPAKRVRAMSPTFGEVALIIFNRGRSKAYALIAPQRLMRRCEALRVWKNHQAVETFWKRMKRWQGLGQMQMRGREGAWAELTLRVMAYLLAQEMLTEDVSTIFQLTQRLRRESTFAELVNKHFQGDLLGLC